MYFLQSFYELLLFSYLLYAGVPLLFHNCSLQCRAVQFGGNFDPISLCVMHLMLFQGVGNGPPARNYEATASISSLHKAKDPLIPGD